MSVKGGLVAADPDRQPSRLGARRPAAHWRIEQVQALFRVDLLRLAHERRRVGGEVEYGRALLEALYEAVLAQRHRLEFRRPRQRCEYDVSRLGYLARRVGRRRSGVQVRRARLAPDVVDNEIVTSSAHIKRHAGAHSSQPNKTLFHVYLLPALIVGCKLYFYGHRQVHALP